MIVAAIFIAGWAVCGFLAYGRTYAHFQRRFPTIAEETRDLDRQFAMLIALIGPVGLLVSLIAGRHGFMWRDPK